MAGSGYAERLAADLRRFFEAEPTFQLHVVKDRPFPGGRELVVDDGTDRASLFLYDSGSIVIESDATRLNYRLKRWEVSVLDTQ